MATELLQPTETIILDDKGDVTVILPYNCTNNSSGKIQSKSAEGGKQDVQHQSSTDVKNGNADGGSQNKPQDDSKENEKNTVPQVRHFKCSQKHLVLASRRVRMVLEGGGKESTKVYADGTRHWTFEPLFNANAFKYVMGIIHGRTKDIPVKLSVDMLAHVATSVDDLQCEDAMWLCAKSWIEHIRSEVPQEMCDDVVKWILIAYVFDEKHLFFECTQLAIRESTGPLISFEFPVVQAILDSIQAARVQAMDDMASKLTTNKASLVENKRDCTPACNQMLLGALMQGMERIKGQLPKSPYEKSKALSMHTLLCTLKSTDMYGPQSDCMYDRYSKAGNWRFYDGSRTPLSELRDKDVVRHVCSLQRLLGFKKNKDSLMSGLSLEDFPRK